jgi:hypothetical protein
MSAETTGTQTYAPLMYALSVVAVELLLLFLLFIFNNDEDWFEKQIPDERRKGCYDCPNLFTLPYERMTLFVSHSATQKQSSEYAIVVIFQYNRSVITRIIDMSYLKYDVKQMFRKYTTDFLHMSRSVSSQSVSVKSDLEAVDDSDSMASVIETLLEKNVQTDLHKIPQNGVRILYLTMQSN